MFKQRSAHAPSRCVSSLRPPAPTSASGRESVACRPNLWRRFYAVIVAVCAEHPIELPWRWALRKMHLPRVRGSNLLQARWSRYGDAGDRTRPRRGSLRLRRRTDARSHDRRVGLRDRGRTHHQRAAGARGGSGARRAADAHADGASRSFGARGDIQPSGGNLGHGSRARPRDR